MFTPPPRLRIKIDTRGENIHGGRQANEAHEENGEGGIDKVN